MVEVVNLGFECEVLLGPILIIGAPPMKELAFHLLLSMNRSSKSAFSLATSMAYHLHEGVAGFGQLAECTRSRYPSMFEEEDPVAVLYGAQTVGNHDDSFLPPEPLDRFHHGAFRDVVKRRGGLVKD